MQLENALRIYSSPVLLTEQTRDIQCAVTEETKQRFPENLLWA